MDEKERSRVLEQTLGQIEKQFGKGSIVRLGAKDSIIPIAVISSGVKSMLEMKAATFGKRAAIADPKPM